MNTQSEFSEMSVDKIIRVAIKQECQLKDFYQRAIREVGPEATLLMAHLYNQHNERIKQLEELLVEISTLRELTGSIAD